MGWRRLVGLLGILMVSGVVMAVLPGLSRAVAAEEAQVSFRWAFGARVASGDPAKLVPITQDTTLQTGDQLKMLVELQKPCFVYVIHHGPAGEVHRLFPYQGQQVDTTYQTAKRYDIPFGEAWIKLNAQVGQETFYLLASAERLVDLEALLAAYTTASQAEQPQIATNILAAIRDLKKRYRQLAAPAERPVPIAGNLRGPELGDLAVEIAAQNFYSKTFTIEHR
jgi:hypothetical protein